MISRVSVLLVGGCSLSYTVALTANPIRKVVTLLQATQKELEEDSRKEKDLYENFHCYCTKNTAGANVEVDQARARIEELTAQIEGAEAEKVRTDQELADHKTARAQAKTELGEATAIRHKERKQYDETVGDDQANIDALTGAIAALSKGMGLGTFLQSHSESSARLKKLVLTNSDLGQFEKRKLMGFLGIRGPYGSYNAAGGEIVGILKEMKDQNGSDEPRPRRCGGYRGAGRGRLQGTQSG